MEPKLAVYSGTILLDNGDNVTYTAEQVAEFYNVADRDYLEVPLQGPFKFDDRAGEAAYIHLKPLRDGRYFDAVERYNLDNELQLKPDFDERAPGKWAQRKRFIGRNDY